MNRRVVFDSSTLVSAALRVDSVPSRAFLKALDEFELCTSQEALTELQRVLSEPKFDRYISVASRRVFLERFYKHARLYTVPVDLHATLTPQCRDPKDQPFLTLAVVAEAATIVSSDADLLSLSPWNGVAIVRPAQFLQEVEFI